MPESLPLPLCSLGGLGRGDPPFHSSGTWTLQRGGLEPRELGAVGSVHELSWPAAAPQGPQCHQAPPMHRFPRFPSSLTAAQGARHG